MKFYEFPIYYYYMVIYSTTNDKPVLGEMRKWDFVKCWQKVILCIEGDRKTPPVECQWNTRLKPPAQTPIFSVSTPPLDIFSVQVYNYFSTLFILAFGRSYDVKNLLKFIILLLRKIEKILTSRHWKIITGGVRASALPSPKTRSEAVLLFNFSTPCQAQLLCKMKIIHIWYFFFFCLLELFCNREGILLANH